MVDVLKHSATEDSTYAEEEEEVCVHSFKSLLRKIALKALH